MVFAAGRGTRLGPLTHTRPKALVSAGGRTLLERVVERLKAAGVTRLVINVSPFAGLVKEFVLARRDFGLDVRFSDEGPRPLETGGGLKAARHLFERTGPILLHNVDVVTDVDLGALLAAHRAADALATLFVATRPSRRALLFDAHGLCGRMDEDRGLKETARAPAGEVRALAFQGIHVIAPRLLDRLDEEGTFSILAPYLRLAGHGERILPALLPHGLWVDAGRPADLERLAQLG